MAAKKKTGKSKPKASKPMRETKKTAAAKPTRVRKEPASKKDRAEGERTSKRLAKLAPEYLGLGTEAVSNAPQAVAPDPGVGASGALSGQTQTSANAPAPAQDATNAPALAQDATNGSAQAQVTTNVPAPGPSTDDSAASALLGAVAAALDDEPPVQSDPQEITYGAEENKAQLTGEIQISASAQSSRRSYAAQFFLQRQGDPDPVHVCDITSWRIDRSTGEWITQFLEADINAKSEEDDDDFETCLCLQGAFSDDGTARVKIWKKQLQAAEQLIFIQTIAVDSQFRRQGLLSPILKHLRRMLRSKLQFDGMLLLIPSRPKGESGDMWEGKKDRDVEDALKRIYKNADVYKTLSANAAVAGHQIPIMGRQVE